MWSYSCKVNEARFFILLTTIDYLSGFNEGAQGQIQNLRVDLNSLFGDTAMVDSV